MKNKNKLGFLLVEKSNGEGKTFFIKQKNLVKVLKELYPEIKRKKTEKKVKEASEDGKTIILRALISKKNIDVTVLTEDSRGLSKKQIVGMLIENVDRYLEA